MSLSQVSSSTMNGNHKDSRNEVDESYTNSSPKTPTQDGRPSSMVIKKVHTIIPPHLVAEAISTLPGVDLRWSGPITPTEMEYVQQYVFAKYPQYSHGLVEAESEILAVKEESSETKLKSTKPKDHLSSLSFNSRTFTELERTKLEPSRLFDILAKKSSFEGNFVSIPEVQARNRALRQFGLAEEDYLVLFTANYKDAMLMVGESYPFFRGNFYMSVLSAESDFIKEFAARKESKVISAPESWLDLRIKGSQLSQYFRKKCKFSPKGLFSYPVQVCSDTKYSPHWISEAHRNSWHVFLDASGIGFADDRIALALHRPDFVLCSLSNNTHAQPSTLTCLLVLRKSFDTLAPNG